MTSLCEIMARQGSDKSPLHKSISHHNQSVFQSILFDKIRNDPIRIFELGLGTNNPNIPSTMGIKGHPGASLHGWAEQFPNASVFGADIDKDILFQTERIQTFQCDQTNPTSIQELWSQSVLEQPFELIIEDGLHTLDANVCFFENSIHKLANGGFYIIEDIHRRQLHQWLPKIEEWNKKYTNCNFLMHTLVTPENPVDNTLIVIRKNQF